MDFGGFTLKLDQTIGDIVTELNRPLHVDGAAKAAQDLWVILKTFMGTDQFNPEMGVDYFTIVDQKYTKDLIRQEIARAIMTYPYVKSIDSIEISDPDVDRKVTIYVSVTLKSGDQVEVEVETNM